MKTLATYMAITLISLGAALPASAECFADYKAKKTDPLKLHYGVVQLEDAFCEPSEELDLHIGERISVGGWTLLNVMSVFGAEGLSERQESAGEYFLTF